TLKSWFIRSKAHLLHCSLSINHNTHLTHSQITAFICCKCSTWKILAKSRHAGLNRGFAVRERDLSGFLETSIMKSRAHLRSHPLHPMLIVFPTAFFSGALFFDVMAVAGAGMQYAAVAYYLLIAGVVT